MKKNELQDFIKAMEGCHNLNLTVGKVVAKNRRAAKEELEIDEEARAKPKGWDEYEEKEKALVKKYAINSDGKRVYFGANEKVFADELKALQYENAELLKEHDRMMKDWIKSMEKEVEFKFHHIKESDVPDNVTSEQYYWLMLFIEDEKEEVSEEKEELKGKKK